jgi:hypothetical protein
VPRRDGQGEGTILKCICAKLGVVILALGGLSSLAGAQSGKSDQPLLEQFRVVERRFTGRVRVAGFRPTKPEPSIRIERGALFAYYESAPNVVHMLRWETASMEARATFNLMAIHCKDGISGRELFRETYYRIFLVHELAHWLRPQLRAGNLDHYSEELEANRIAVAFWSRNPADRAWLGKMIERYRRVLTQLPNPVPKGEDRREYFNRHRDKWVRDGALQYGSYQLGMIVEAWDEPERPQLGEIVRRLREGK